MPTIEEALDNPKVESPLAAYNRLLQQNRDRLALEQSRDKVLGYAKIALGLLAVFLLVRFVQELHGIWPLLVVAAVFVVLAVVHERVLARIRVIKSIVVHYERGVAGRPLGRNR